MFRYEMARNEEDFPEFVSQTLHNIGYKWEIIQLRRDSVKHQERIVNDGPLLSGTGLSAVGAGSKREGTGTPFGADSDQMFVFDEVIATENVPLFENERNHTVLKLDLNECPPGYSFLIVEKHGGSWHKKFLGDVFAMYLLQFLVGSSCSESYSGATYLSSEIFIHTMSKVMQLDSHFIKNNLCPDGVFVNMVSLESRTGPSIPTLSDAGFVRASHDNVFAIPCHCPSIFEKFRNRPRRNGWPPESVLQELSQLEAHVVPVGCKSSASVFLEWRICFTKAEIRLIEFLTEPQIQVFILLKIFAKDVLKEVWDVITSYVVKNVILWIAELTPRHRFHTDTIVDRFLACLFYLKVCIKAGRLPNYIIDERNLFSHDQFIVKKRKLLSTLDDCLREKGSCLFRSSRLKEAMTKMYSNRDLAIKEGLERDKSERAILCTMSRICQVVGPATSMQDMMRFVLSGGTADILRLFLERFPIQDIERDPSVAIQKLVESFFSQLE